MFRARRLALLLVGLLAGPTEAARNFVAASSQYLEAGTAAATVAPMTVCAWAQSSDTTTGQAVVSIADTGTTNNYWTLRFAGAATGDPVQWAVRAGGSSEQVGATATGYSASTWYHICGRETSATNRDASIDGTFGTANTTSRAPSGADTTSIGRTRGTSAVCSSCLCNCDIAEVAVWTVALSNADVASLSASRKPMWAVRPDVLVSYWTLYGVNSPETDRWKNRIELTVTGATASVHPRINGWMLAWDRREDTAPPAAGQPTMRRWEQVPHLPSGKGRGGIVRYWLAPEEIPCLGRGCEEQP